MQERERAEKRDVWFWRRQGGGERKQDASEKKNTMRLDAQVLNGRARTAAGLRQSRGGQSVLHHNTSVLMQHNARQQQLQRQKKKQRQQQQRESGVRGSPACFATAAPMKDAESVSMVEQLQKTRLITAIKTPYLQNGKFDLKAYDRFLEKQIENGVEVSRKARRFAEDGFFFFQDLTVPLFSFLFLGSHCGWYYRRRYEKGRERGK